MKIYLLLLVIGLSGFMGCSEREECIAELVESCPVTFNIDHVCGCDDMTYVNPSEAECHQIYVYTEGECDE